MISSYVPWWSKRGIRLHVILPAADDQTTQTETINDVTWHRFKPGKVIGPEAPASDEAIRFALQIITALPARADEAHLLMPYDNATPDGPGLLAEARKAGIACLMPLHMCPVPPRRWSLRDHVREWRDRRWWRGYSAVHANSHVSAAAMCRAAGMPPSWARVIVNGVDTQRFRPPHSANEKAETRRALGLPEEGFIALFVGGATHRKGVDFLLDAWERFAQEHPPGGTLVLIGSANRAGSNSAQNAGARPFAEYFHRRMAEVSRIAPVRHIDFVSDLQHHYRAADAFTFASRQEGMPNAVLEAMSSGLPVICTRFLGFPWEGCEIGYDGQHFISAPRAVSTWSRLLGELASNPARREQIGSSARRWMQCYQEIEMVTAQSAEFFHGLARKLPELHS